MLENVLADLKHYREHSGGGGNKSLFWVLFAACYAHPAMVGVLFYRFGNWSWRLPIPGVRGICKLLYLLLLPIVRLYSGVQIHPRARIGKGLVILHFGGVIICRECRIGEQCLLHHGVNIVTTNSRMAAHVGNNFYAGVGVKIVNHLIIEDNVICGAGSVVTRSVPANAIVAGVPARIVRFRRADEKPPRYVRGHHDPAPFLEVFNDHENKKEDVRREG
jgi:serine O-acetyltransferase